MSNKVKVKQKRKRKPRAFKATKRSVSAIRARERERVLKRFSAILDPDAVKKRNIKRRKRGPKAFTRVSNTARSLERQVRRMNVFFRTAKSVKRSLISARDIIGSVLPFVIGASNVRGPRVTSR